MAAAQDDRRRDYDYFEPLRPYPPPVDLPMLPRYDVDIPAEQDGKMFGHVAATKYETVSISIGRWWIRSQERMFLHVPRRKWILHAYLQ